ncbi:hypothetical protein [Dyella nitratireducens]|uniref:Nucleotidyltransferase family protein n=1 Tax=Dyella nitratireducens TaxID=1849580 RepID=A0ABQ1GMH9_9GAMM|nr:hypothetical protein [Dyella nitratireducens]GGA46738.1 hypothetical protein GCM10010981_39880 [Dyella nitratireducens]GLQ41490.1 hypothetical protein GCM10007902_13400 [Dyella nitratireducens]
MTLHSLSSALHEVIAASVPLLQRHCCDPWVVIGSAACALAGACVDVADLDVLASTADAERLIALWPSRRDTTYAPAGADRFRSHFARFLFPGMPVEVMGDLQLHGAHAWQAVQVNDVVHVQVADIAVPIPSRCEQIRILESFGRPKDRARAELLRAL